ASCWAWRTCAPRALAAQPPFSLPLDYTPFTPPLGDTWQVRAQLQRHGDGVLLHGLAADEPHAHLNGAFGTVLRAGGAAHSSPFSWLEEELPVAVEASRADLSGL
ncbi:MAG: hypothetical protein VXW43_19955, partial [Pseudomonadota bacterium]|nr:hypothetical protein [Pseudomonadota bacterium]